MHATGPPDTGPVCLVVWEGRGRKAPPYPDSALSGRLTNDLRILQFLYGCVNVTEVGDIDAWNDATQSRVRGQHKVKDVCAKCNNGPLSALDLYGKSFVELNNIHKPILAESIL
jgi:hypothetical protein